MNNKKESHSIIRKLWKYFFYTLIGIPLFLILVNFGILGSMPDFEELENPRSSIASELYSEDGVMLGQYYLQKRSYVGYHDISKHVFDALISTEDERFYKHSGIDVRRLGGAILGLGKRGGASTITQQLAKNLFHYENGKRPNVVVRLIQKLKEWVIAIKLERSYTKEEIATMYLNTVQFSGLSYGIKSASHQFFKKKPSELTIDEGAILVGMLKAISLYNPKSKPEKALIRRNIVFGQMLRNKKITKEEFETLKKLPIKLNYQHEDHNEGLAIYFKEYLKKDLNEWCKKNKKPNGENYNLYKDGLKIYTTIDSRLQKHAEAAAAKHLKELQKQFFSTWGKSDPWRDEDWKLDPNYPVRELRKTPRYIELKKIYKKDTASIMKICKTPVKMEVFSWNGTVDTLMSPLDSVKYMKKFLHTGFVAMNPYTGQVKAWVGGINHKFFQYDHVNKSAGRQVGSTFKPFVYALAIDNKISPCTDFPNTPPPYPDWRVRNSNGKYGGSMDMYRGIATSTNTIVAQVLYSMGRNAPQSVIDFVRRMGIDSAKLEPVAPICLGVTDISPFDMAGAFCTFVNKGFWTQPTYLTRIEDKNGNVLAEFGPEKITQILTEEKAYIVCKLLEGVCKPGGTAYRRLGNSCGDGWVGGKTGTTQSNSDGWFMAVTTDLVCATWVGCDSRKVRFRSTAYGQGAHSALPIFANFIKSAREDKKLNIKLEPIPEPEFRDGIDHRCGDVYTPDDVDVNEYNVEDDLGI